MKLMGEREEIRGDVWSSHLISRIKSQQEIPAMNQHEGEGEKTSFLEVE